MTKEEKREYDRKLYEKNREKRLEANKRWRDNNPDKEKARKEREKKSEAYEQRKKRWRDTYHTEEYRAKRRAEYAAKHANDPMTPHRAAMIAAFQERCKKPIEERRAEKLKAEAHAQFLKDLKAEESV